MIAAVARTIGDNVQAILDRRGMSQVELAKKIGATTPTINNWVQGRRQGVQAPNLLRLAKGLGEPVEALFEGLDEDYDRWLRSRGVDAELQRSWRRLNADQKRSIILLLESFLDEIVDAER